MKVSVQGSTGLWCIVLSDGPSRDPQGQAVKKMDGFYPIIFGSAKTIMLLECNLAWDDVCLTSVMNGHDFALTHYVLVCSHKSSLKVYKIKFSRRYFFQPCWNKVEDALSCDTPLSQRYVKELREN